MKKFTANAIAIAVGTMVAGASFAGSISSPANDNAATVYAVEALTNATDITAPVIVYTMGVPRTTAQDFTVIITPSAGASFTAGSCATATPVFGGTGAATVSLKRSGTTECAWEVDVTTASVIGDTLTFTGLVFDTHTLGAAGQAASITLALKDLGETAFIDNSGTLTRRVATSAQSVNIYAAASDTATTADVNATGGPLTGFVVVGNDTALNAKASLTFDNNSINAKLPDGTTNFDFTATAGTASITLTGNNTGAAANQFCIDLDNDATLCEAGEVFTLSSSTVATRGAIASSAFPAQGATATRTVSFQATGNTPLGTSRTFAVTGAITPAVGAENALANTNSVNATWWVWTANASQLMTPYFTTNSIYLTRFFLLNTTNASVGYNATCYSESGNTITYGSAQTGTLTANGLTAVNARDVCTFAGASRGAILFTINAPISSIKGSYQYIDQTTLNGVVVPMTRPYNTNTTE